MNFKIILTTLIILMLSANIALAIPGIPNTFYGTVTWNGQPAPDGTTVKAKINGVQVASTTTVGGKYGYPAGTFLVDDPNNDRVGKTISFFVNDVDTEQTVVFSGTQSNFVLNLVATGSTSNPSPSPSSGGSPGGSFVGTSSGTTNVSQNQTNGTQSQVCHEKWICGDWGNCQNGIQTRTCKDESKCGTNNNEPFTSQPCSKEEIAKTEQAQAPFMLPTGFFLGLSATDWITGFVVAIVAAVIVVFLFKRKKVAAPLNTIVPSTVISV